MKEKHERGTKRTGRRRTRKFWDFRSRWIMFMSCRYATAFAISSDMSSLFRREKSLGSLCCSASGCQHNTPAMDDRKMIFQAQESATDHTTERLRNQTTEMARKVERITTDSVNNTLRTERQRRQRTNTKIILKPPQHDGDRNECEGTEGAAR